ncbi:MAG: HD domain-containing protein [Steroidobacteraceae bacterium]
MPIMTKGRALSAIVCPADRTALMALMGALVLLCPGVSAAATQSSQTPAAPDSARAGDWRTTVRDFAAEHFKHPAWGYSHCVRDYSLARELAAADRVKLDDDVLFAAAYLHDMAGFAPWEKQKVDHADEGALVVDTVLKGTGFPMTKIDAVRGAIRTHNYDRTPVGPEALYLHDADALDWLGDIGVARIIALVDPNGGQPDGAKAVSILEENRARVPEHVLSAAGRALVPERKAELERFLTNLRRESDDLRTL